MRENHETSGGVSAQGGMKTVGPGTENSGELATSHFFFTARVLWQPQKFGLLTFPFGKNPVPFSSMDELVGWVKTTTLVGCIQRLRVRSIDAD